MARAARVTEKDDAGEKLARQRLSALELAQALGGVSEARRRGAAWTGPQLLRVEAALPDPRLRRAQGPAADRPLAPAGDHPARGGRSASASWR